MGTYELNACSLPGTRILDIDKVKACKSYGPME